MLSPFTFVVISIISIGCCVACGRGANKKGRNPIPYAILGMVLPIIGLIVVLTRSNLNANPVTEEETEVVMKEEAEEIPTPNTVMQQVTVAEAEPEAEFEFKPVEVKRAKEKEKVDYAKLIMHKDDSLGNKRIRLDIIDSRTGELYQRIGYRENAAFVNIKNIEPGKYRFALWIHDVFYNKFEWRVAAETYMTVEPGEEYEIRLTDRIILFEGYTTEEVVEAKIKEVEETKEPVVYEMSAVKDAKKRENVSFAKLIMNKDNSLDGKRIRIDIIDSRTGELYQRIGYRENATFVNIKNIEPGKYRFALWIHDVFYNKFEWRVAAETYMTVEPGEEYDIRLTDRIIIFEGYTAEETPKPVAVPEPEPDPMEKFESKPVEVKCAKEKEKVDYAKLIMHKDDSLGNKRIRLDIIDNDTHNLYQQIGYRENANAFGNIKNIATGDYMFVLFDYRSYGDCYEWFQRACTHMKIESEKEYNVRFTDKEIIFEGYTTEETPKPVAVPEPEPDPMAKFEFRLVELKHAYISEGYDRKRYYIYPVEVRENIFEEDTDYPQLRGIFKLAAKIGKFITERNDKLLSIKIGGGSTEVSHTGDVAFDASYSSLNDFVNNFNRDYEKAKKEAEREYGSWFSGLNFNYIKVRTSEYVVSLGTGVKVEIPVSRAKDGWEFLVEFVKNFEGTELKADAGAEEIFWDKNAKLLGRKFRLNEKGSRLHTDYYLTEFIDRSGEIVRYDFEYLNVLYELSVEQMDIINKYLNEKSEQQYERGPVTSMCMYIQAMDEKVSSRIYDMSLWELTSRLVDAKCKYETKIKIVSEEQEEYEPLNEIARYYQYDRLDDIFCANSILGLLAAAGAEFRKFSRPADYVDHCDYNMTHKYDDYEDFLKGGGLAFSLEEPYSSINFNFTFDGVPMSGRIHESGSFINEAFFSKIGEGGREKAEKALDKVQDIVKEVYL